MTLEHKADYVEEGLGRLLSQFGDKPRIRALLAAGANVNAAGSAYSSDS